MLHAVLKPLSKVAFQRSRIGRLLILVLLVCVDRLKIRPVTRFINKIGRAVRVPDVRADESSFRMRTTEIKGKRPAIFSWKSPTLRPIIGWTESDVVERLKADRRWDEKSFDYLISLYGYEIEDAKKRSSPTGSPGG